MLKNHSFHVLVTLLLVVLLTGCASDTKTDSTAQSAVNTTEATDGTEQTTESLPEEQEGQALETESIDQSTEQATEETTQQEDMHTPVNFTVTDPQNERKLSTKYCSFSFGAAKDGKPNTITVNNQKTFDEYGYSTLAWDNKTKDKVLYLTFDCGYEYENLTSDILDTLKEKNVKAAFFCTLHYLTSSPDAVSRMVEEGHIVGNHTAHHPSDCSTLSRQELADEIQEVHNYMRENYGYQCEYFRFPGGVYSENALELVQSVGYHSVFWSIAYADWDPKDQPSRNQAYQTLTSRLHPGAVILLHGTSPVSAEVLGEFIDYARSQGYEFSSLDGYKYW